MTQFEFDKLLEKYLAGECNEEEQLFVEEWTDKQIANVVVFPLPPADEIAIEKRLKSRIDASTSIKKRAGLGISAFYRWGIAATIISVVALCAWFWTKQLTSSPLNEGIDNKMAGFELSNTTHSEQEFKLKDGSSITLKPQSSLTYLENFGLKNRIVFLKGEGFFQVKSDSTKPFYVYAGNLVTKVLGTSFSVKSYEEGTQGEVTVTSGRVMVYEKQQGKYSKMIVLTPNQKVVYSASKTNMAAQIVDNPIATHPVERKEDFVFEKTPLKMVLERLKKVYSVEILMKNKSLEHCLFTGDLNGLSLYQQLDLICQSVDAKYQPYETAIWIDGDGCSE